MFQHTAARRRLGKTAKNNIHGFRFQHTAARRRLVRLLVFTRFRLSFNTQPPEGGWFRRESDNRFFLVSTHSRPKAAGSALYSVQTCYVRFQHTAARRRLAYHLYHMKHPHSVSTHSRPKAAGETENFVMFGRFVSTHSRPKAAGNPTKSEYN